MGVIRRLPAWRHRGFPMCEYTIAVESLPEVYRELEPICREHYAEMTSRLKENGIEVSAYNPRLEEYFKASRGGWLITIILRGDGKICGYINVYVTQDMHNNDFIAQEDVLFVTQAHRNGIGKKLVQFGLEELRRRNVRRLSVSALTSQRVIPLWKRLGFKEVATQMIYTFEAA